MARRPRRLRKAIRLRNAVALYTSSVLGSGILVLPGLTAQIAGPASILAWILLSFASYPFAFTFASLSARKAESGGVYSFAREAFGLRIATVAGWLFLLWDITGAPAVALIAASYVAYAIPISRTGAFMVAFVILLVTFVVNYRGIILSNRVQLAVISAIVALLLVAIIFSSPFVRMQNFSPFLPKGLVPIGTAAALIFWSYLGYENVSNVAEEFENPQRDFHRSVLFSVILVSVLYTSVALVTVGTLAYEAGGSVAPFSAILSNVLGTYAAVGTAILAVFIIFGLINAYTTGMSRVFYSAALDGGFPRALAHLNSRTKVPDRVLLIMFGSMVPILVIYYFTNVNLETALLISSGAAILIYVIGFAAGVKILRRESARKRVMALISLLISLIVLPFVGPFLAISVIVAIAAIIYHSVRQRKWRTKGTSEPKMAAGQR